MTSKIFCVLGDDPKLTGFPIDFDDSRTVGDLKKAIRAENMQDLGHLDAKKLTLVRTCKTDVGGLTKRELKQSREFLNLRKYGDEPEDPDDADALSTFRAAPGKCLTRDGLIFKVMNSMEQVSLFTASLPAKVYHVLVLVPNKTSPTNSLSSLTAGDEIEFTQNSISLELNGINLDSPHLDRIELLKNISHSLETNRFVLLSSPAGSGKTSVLQLFAKWTKVPCKYTRASTGSSCFDVLRNAGIDMVTRSYNGTSGKLVVMIDDAQNSYHDRPGWESLIKEIPLWLSPSVKFVISATHSLKGGVESPVEFKSLPTFNRMHFLLSELEATMFLDSAIGLRNDMKFESLKQNVITQCGGLIGALRLSVNGLTAAFAKSEPSETEALLYFLSADVVSRMARVFGSDHSLPIADNFKNFLAECFTSGFTKSPRGLSADDDMCFTRLQKAGIMVEDQGLIKFSSIMGQRYFIQWLFPNRSSSAPPSLRVLIEDCIRNMSCNLLTRSVVDGFPKEATFQHLLMEGLAKFTPPACSICPELSKIFPVVNHTGGKISGEVDFYLNGSLRWGVELLVLGRGITEHIDRFGLNGKYFKLDVKDYIIVDFRSSQDGQPTNVQRHPKRVSVFFKDGDYTACNCIFGLEEHPVVLYLSH
ncbi:hypothetical protein HDU83_007573 [Entophlyctis luteolus]|nr:hypothetical protein HDU83_007573 [Entophlyctis luteolus]